MYFYMAFALDLCFQLQGQVCTFGRGTEQREGGENCCQQGSEQGKGARGKNNIVKISNKKRENISEKAQKLLFVH